MDRLGYELQTRYSTALAQLLAARGRTDSLSSCGALRYASSNKRKPYVAGACTEEEKQEKNRSWSGCKHTVSASHMRQTAILHHSHPTCIRTHAGPRAAAVWRLMRPSSSILLWIIHHLRLLSRLLLLLVGVVGCAIRVEGLRVGPWAKAIRRCIHGVWRMAYEMAAIGIGIPKVGNGWLL